jgi:phosphinothricin acetyltransferase
MHIALAVVAQPNPASVALHERLGFELVGTFGEVGRKFDRWIDTRWYQLRLDP